MSVARRGLLRRELLEGAAALTAGLLLPRAASAKGGELLVQTDYPQNLGTPIELYDRLITPTASFFVRSHFGPPALDPKRALIVEGSRKLELGVAQLRKLKEHTLTAVLQCSGNGRALHSPRVPGIQWVHGAMGQATWTGVRLSDVLEQAGLPAGAAFVRVVGADVPAGPKVPRFIRGLPLDRALDPATIIAYRMNGAPLSLAHGAPMRLVIPGWSGNHWVKWLRSIRVQAEDAEGFYHQTAYRLPKTPVAPGTAVKPADTLPATTFPLRAVIARPSESGRVRRGKAEVVGVALSGEAAVARVEVSLDGGATWAPAKLEGEPGIGLWQVFRLPFDARPGAHVAVARAFDAQGRAQPEQAAWNPSGYFWNGWHRVGFEVAS